MPILKSQSIRWKQALEDPHVKGMYIPVVEMLKDIPENIELQWNFTKNPSYNLEPLINSIGYTQYVDMLKEYQKPIYDFDKRNTELLKSIGLNAKYRPICATDSLIEWCGDPKKDRDIDVLFVGTDADRRAKILERIPNVTIIKSAYGQELTALLQRAKICVNIHREGQLQAQEQVRIAHAVLCGAVVVSEASIDPTIGLDVIREAYAGNLHHACEFELKTWSMDDALTYRERYIRNSKEWLWKYWKVLQ